MRIVHVNHRDIRNPRAGGLEVLVHEFSRRWVAQGHQVTILCSGFSGGLAKEVVDGISTYRTGREEFFNFIAGAQLVRKKWFEADVIIEHLCKVACFIPWFLRGHAFLAEVPHLFDRHIFRETNLLLGSYVYFMERAIPVVYHSCPVWTISQSTKKKLVERGFTDGKIGVFSPGVDQNFLRGDRKPAARPSVLFIGRLRRYKGLIDPLLIAWKDVLKRRPDAVLQIVGRGELEGELRGAVKSGNMEGSVKILGGVDEEKKRELLRSAWMLVFPSAVEGWGIPVIEAGVVGIPTVASDSPGLRDTVRHGETGLLVPHGDAKALADALVQMMEDDSLRERFGLAAKKWGEQFDWDNQARMALEFVVARAKTSRQ
jgi:glycosyltransferase involved in cell wall biosynthesis